VLATTDRQSAFDRVLAAVPFKGQVLTGVSAWWMRRTSDICPNAMLEGIVGSPDPNIAVMRQCDVLPIEVVVRGYMTGSTSTSLWTHYSRGERNYCGNVFPDGLVKNAKLDTNVLTPTTKADDGDVPIAPADAVAQGLLTQQEWNTVSQRALALFEYGQREAASRGLILVDTKYEFGRVRMEDTDSNDVNDVLLIDEIHTPDSSRYWLMDSYASRHAQGLEPESIDKEFLRLWFRDRCDPYNDAALPEAPADLVAELSRRYVHLFERITGEEFVPMPAGLDGNERMRRALERAGVKSVKT